MIARKIQPVLTKRLAQFPIVALVGPRQSGKTTLARHAAGRRPYISLEDPDHYQFALSDPRGFLAQFPDGAVFDEVQRCPQIFSYLQGIVDNDGRMGLFILTGSQQFGMIEAINQSLAGRIALLQLWPFSLSELQAANAAPPDIDTLLAHGLFPPLYGRKVEPADWLSNYVATYLERDVRVTLNVQNLAAFQRFTQLCAGRVGQLVNLTSLASDAGVSRVTAEAWLSVLQASHLIFLVQPWSSNFSKRLIKTPKIYFCDPGLAAWFLGATTRDYVSVHPQRGSLFENWVMTELLKAQTNAGLRPSLTFLRDKTGHEVDAFVQTAPGTFSAIEVKSGATVVPDFFDGLDFWRAHLPKLEITPWLVHGGTIAQQRKRGTVLPWNATGPLLKSLAQPRVKRKRKPQHS